MTVLRSVWIDGSVPTFEICWNQLRMENTNRTKPRTLRCSISFVLTRQLHTPAPPKKKPLRLRCRAFGLPDSLYLRTHRVFMMSR